MSAPRLRYFNFPGRCYAARVALFNAFGKEGWVDERIGQVQWKKLKEQATEQRAQSEGIDPVPALVSNSLPELILPDGETRVTQSHAIARWAARQKSGNTLYSLYPNALDHALLVDESMSLVDSMVGFAPKDADKEVRMNKRKEYADRNGSLGIGMAILESRLAKQGGGPFLLGQELSIGDLYLKKPLTDMILDKQFDGVPPEYLDKFPLIRKHTDAVAAHPLIEEYMKHYKN